MSHKKHYNPNKKTHSQGGGPNSPGRFSKGNNKNGERDVQNENQTHGGGGSGGGGGGGRSTPPPGFSPRISKEEDGRDEEIGEGEEVDEREDRPQEDSVVLGGVSLVDPNNFAVKHPLQNKWSMWWDKKDRKSTQDTWGDNLNKLVDFDTVEDFWRLYNNIVPASALSFGSNYHLFKYGVEPKWEDKANEKGGKWVINFTAKGARGKVDDCWLNTVLACIGESFGEAENDICGAVISIRRGQDRLALWTRNATDETACVIIGRVFKQCLMIPDKQKIGYQLHNDARAHNSSYGNENYYEV